MKKGDEAYLQWLSFRLVVLRWTADVEEEWFQEALLWVTDGLRNSDGYLNRVCRMKDESWGLQSCSGQALKELKSKDIRGEGPVVGLIRDDVEASCRFNLGSTERIRSKYGSKISINTNSINWDKVTQRDTAGLTTSKEWSLSGRYGICSRSATPYSWDPLFRKPLTCTSKHRYTPRSQHRRNLCLLKFISV